MSMPRRPSAGRPSAGRRPARAGARPAAARAASSRPPARPASRATTARPSGAGRAAGRSGRLSPSRIAVLVLVAVTLLVSAALPLREFVRQRGQIDELAQRNADARARVAELEAEHARQQDPAHVMAEARRRLHFVVPGETMYVLLEPTPAPGAEGDDGPWWSRLWDTVEQADQLPPSGAAAVPPELGTPLGQPGTAPAEAGASPAPSPPPTS